MLAFWERLAKPYGSILMAEGGWGEGSGGWKDLGHLIPDLEPHVSCFFCWLFSRHCRLLETFS